MSVSVYNSTNGSTSVSATSTTPTISATTTTTSNLIMNNKDLKKKFLKTFDLSQIAEDPMDIFLDTLGLWKKRIARDGSCLFRAVAEQIYPCQLHHERVRQECIKYMSNNRDLFSKYVVSISFDDYLEALKNPLEYGGQLEIAAMSKLYKRDFIIYHHPDQPGVDVTQNGYEKNIYLCYSYNNHFDAIFTKSHRDNLALIQSLVYEILYEKVFGSGEQVSIARRLLRKSDTIYPKEFMNLRNLNEFDNELDIEEEDEENEDDIANQEQTSNDTKTDENNNENTTSDEKNSDSISTNKTDDIKSIKLDSSVLDKNAQSQKMPLPYKVAKSLDPVIYRNTAFDAWLAVKKEYEECLNQKAISSLHPGDKCLVRLNNNFMDKWNLAYLHTIQHDLANVFVVELNENHCVGLENLKPFTNDMTLPNQSGYYHHYGNNCTSNNSSGGSTYSVNSIKNVQKLVQSLNPQFSKIFLSTENKRRTNLKKKQFAIKKSYSFHAISAELPTLIEVEEQLDDTYGANSHPYYLNDQSNPAFNNFGLATANFPLNYQTYIHPSHHVRPPQIPHSQTYYSQPVQYSNDSKLNSTNKLTTSISASNLSYNNNNNNKQTNQLPTSQSANIITSNKNNNTLLMSATNISNLNKNNRRNQRYNQNQQHTNLNPNFDSKHQTTHWPTNGFFNPTNPQLNTYMPPPPNHAMQPPPPPPLINIPGNVPPPFSNQSHNTPFGSNMSLPPLVNQSGYIPPPPQQMTSLQPLSANSILPPPPPPPPQFMHPPPQQLPSIPSNQANSQSNQRQSFFNSTNSNYMMSLPPPPPPPPAAAASQSTIPSNNYNMINGSDSSYYFPNSNNNCNLLFPNSTPLNYNNYNKFQTNQRKNDSKLDTYDNQSVGFQPTNTSNYLLMPAPCNKNNKNFNSSSSLSTATKSNKTDSLNSGLLDSTTPNQSNSNLNSLPRSHSYHSGVSAQSYDLSQTNNSNVYVDVYPSQTNTSSNHQENLSIINNSNNNATTTNNNAINSSASSSCLNDINNLINSNSSYPTNQSTVINNSTSSNNLINPTANLENSSLMYGSNNFQNYELQYPRFDNNLNDDTFLINSNDRQMNLWNKNSVSQTTTNKLITKTNGFNDTLYNTNGVTSVLGPAATTAPPLATNLNDKTNQQFCYSNCLVVNIDGPINFNATHSLLDDGSDLPFNDINTIRFFYNVGIEYYRLNLAGPYNQQNGYSTCYAPPGPPPPQHAPLGMSLLPNSNMPTNTTSTITTSASSCLPVNNTTTTSNLSNTTNTTTLGSLNQSSSNQSNTSTLGLNNMTNKTSSKSETSQSIDSNNNYVNIASSSTSSSKNLLNKSQAGSNRRY